jgi:hypothetical protein
MRERRWDRGLRGGSFCEFGVVFCCCSGWGYMCMTVPSGGDNFVDVGWFVLPSIVWKGCDLRIVLAFPCK